MRCLHDAGNGLVPLLPVMEQPWAGDMVGRVEKWVCDEKKNVLIYTLSETEEDINSFLMFEKNQSRKFLANKR